MAPTLNAASAASAATVDRRGNTFAGHEKAALSTAGDILESWAEGYMVGSLVILTLILLCNYRRHILLHKLILLEMMLALLHGTFIFLDDPAYGWYLSATALLLFISYQVHNVVAFLKIRPFLPRWGRRVFIITLLCVQPFWVVEAWDNFEYFNSDIDWNIYTRPWEALFRDPWWIFTTCFVLYKIKTQYEFTALSLLRTSNRLVVMLVCMILSIAFLLADVIVQADGLSQDAGINPYWRLALVFKCAADTIFLDDFKSVLDSITAKRFSEFRFEGARRNAYANEGSLETAQISPTRAVPPPGVLQDPGNIAAVSVPSSSEQGKEKRSRSRSRSRQALDPLWAELGYGHGAMPISEHVEDTFHFPPASTPREGESGDGASGKRILLKPQKVHSRDLALQ